MNDKKIRIFIDTDIVVDFFSGREPFAGPAAMLFTLAEQGKLSACVSALTIANCYYILKRHAPHRQVIEKLVQFSTIVEILDIQKESIVKAFHSGFTDFEDAIQYEVARQEPGITIIITRNVRDYRKSRLAVMTPEEYLRILGDTLAACPEELNDEGLTVDG